MNPHQTLKEFYEKESERCPENILRLISSIEGAYGACKHMGFEEDQSLLNEMKMRYYKLYFKLKREEKNANLS